MEAPTTTGVRDMSRVRDRFGGFDIPASLVGLLAAIGTIVLLAGLIAAGAGNAQYQLDLIDVEGNIEELAVGGFIVSLLVLLVAFFVGGWTAARSARYDGGKNGLLVAFWMVLLIAVFAAAGAWAGQEYNLFAQIEMPDWVSQWDTDERTAAGIVAGLIGMAVIFLGAYIGGRVGELYTNKVDAAVANAPRAPLPS